jgi:sortase (surface protein transpeptidase)
MCAVLVAGGVAVHERPSPAAGRDRVTHAAAVRGGASEPSPAPTFRSVRTYPAVAEPVRLRIPSIRVRTDLQHLGLAADGTVAAPDEWQTAGWYEKGPRPGQPGPAVIVGHVDSKTGPAVFYRLPELRPGAKVLVDLANGRTVTFTVTGHQQVAKSQFPADLVYSPTLQTILRLVTCGGTFDASTGHYRDNIIVTAVAAS